MIRLNHYLGEAGASGAQGAWKALDPNQPRTHLISFKD